MRSIELFAGCGGLAFGLAEAGFEHALVIENDPHASATLEKNKLRGVRHFAGWPIKANDVREVKYADVGGEVDLVAGGPPCQPFSIGGKHKGPSDPRNMWPEAIRAVRELQPKAFLFENVRGLLRPGFGDYLSFLRLQLQWPSLKNSTKGWRDHLQVLKKREKSGAMPSYRVVIEGINAADYGAPQKRHRAIILGVRSDVADEVTFPAPTHSHEALVWSQHVDEMYWDRHKISARARPAMTASDEAVLQRLQEQDEPPNELPWTTVRDAIGDLPAPSVSKKSAAPDEPTNHRLHPGARVYERHTGSTWDEPAKALKAGDHGVPGGENVLVGRGGAVRYFTIREMTRLQGLPDDFDIDGNWKNPIKQLGNAVPVHVGHIFGTVLRQAIQKPAS
ncbi:MAG: DNA-cytosine methyltransferase [Myxococcales bacterium]|nr:DNA-cytosine methyltransferase [Myxococcales bacterium]